MKVNRSRAYSVTEDATAKSIGFLPGSAAQ
jgi:hypothetical protein